MAQIIYSNCKIVGLENVNYRNYRGQMVTGLQVSFISQFPEDSTLQGVRCHRQWITSDKLGGAKPQLGDYFNFYYEMRNGSNGEFEAFVRLEKHPYPVEFKID